MNVASIFEDVGGKLMQEYKDIENYNNVVGKTTSKIFADFPIKISISEITRFESGICFEFR